MSKGKNGELNGSLMISRSGLRLFESCRLVMFLSKILCSHSNFLSQGHLRTRLASSRRGGGEPVESIPSRVRLGKRKL